METPKGKEILKAAERQTNWWEKDGNQSDSSLPNTNNGNLKTANKYLQQTKGKYPLIQKITLITSFKNRAKQTFSDKQKMRV